MYFCNCILPVLSNIAFNNVINICLMDINRLRSFNVTPTLMKMFYLAFIESVLSLSMSAGLVV